MDINLILIGVGIAVVFLVVGLAVGESLATVRLHPQIEKLQQDYAKVKQEYAHAHGLWATDRPNLIESRRLKDLFYRIGYPGEKL